MDSAGKIAVWALTPNGAALAGRIQAGFPEADLYLARDLEGEFPDARRFKRLGAVLEAAFQQYEGHVCIMAAGIVVRMIAPLLVHKTVDPAVVVLDEKGRHAISFLAGHVGGANRLCRQIAALIGAEAVITTATDVNQLPAIDTLAVEKGLQIENPAAIKGVNKAFLERRPFFIYDPLRLLDGMLPGEMPKVFLPGSAGAPLSTPHGAPPLGSLPGIFVDDRVRSLPEDFLILRPRSLVVGIGCNRNTPLDEMESFLVDLFENEQLAAKSIARLATIDLKSDEPGLLALARKWNLPVDFYTREELKKVHSIKTPSRLVARHIGVESVCEAAAILASSQGNLIVPKQATRNVTLAIARRSFM